MAVKILYAGSPEPARKALEILFNNQSQYNFEIVGVLSNPPSAKGRHKALTPTPVAEFALENNIPTFTPEHLNAEARESISPLKPDLLVCFCLWTYIWSKIFRYVPNGRNKPSSFFIT